MNAPFSMHTGGFFHNPIEQESRTLMRIKVAAGIWLPGTSPGIFGTANRSSCAKEALNKSRASARTYSALP
ncbi:MAG: hypothetical protein Q7K57_42865 [Burkholderiaceae bacterium]|nr:hypothetical protein [Burkholderiaceae bacterium]